MVLTQANITLSLPPALCCSTIFVATKASTVDNSRLKQLQEANLGWYHFEFAAYDALYHV